jgi:ArsR family transcriptional regulator
MARLTHQHPLIFNECMTSTTTDARSGREDSADATTATTAVPNLLGVVADPMRWRILTLLADTELCTTHLQDLLGAKQNLVSHHLKVLREGGLVLTEPCGRFTYYRLKPGALDSLLAAVGHLASASHAEVSKRPC